MADYTQTDPAPSGGTSSFQAEVDSTRLLNMAITELTRPMAELPRAAGVSTAPMAEQLRLATKSRDEQNALITKNTQLATEATQREKDALASQAEAQAELIKGIQQREQRIADGYAYYQTLFGLQPDHNALIATLGNKVREELPVAMQQLGEIREMQAVGPLDNPLEWLYNTIQLPSRIQSYNRSADRIEGMQRTINKGIETASAAGDLNSKTVPATTTVMADAKAKIALAESQRLASAADIALSRISTEFNAKKMAGDLAIFGATAQMTQVQLENSKLAYAAAIDKIRLADSHAMRLLEAGKVIEMINANKDKNAAGLATDAMLRRYELVVGYPAGSISRHVFMTLSNAQQQNIMAIGAGSGGTTAFEYLRNMEAARPGPLFSENQKTLLSYLREQSEKITLHPTLLNASQAEKDRYLGKMLDQRLAQERELPYTSKLFQEMTPAEMIKARQVDPNSQLGQALATISQDSARPKTELVVQTIAKTFKNPAEAGAVIAEYYRKNIQYNNDAMNLQFAGIKGIDSYKVVSPVGPIFGAKQQFDLMKADEATKYVLTVTRQQEIKERSEQLTQEYRETYERM